MEELRFEEDVVIEKKDYSGVKKLIIKDCECTVSAGAFEGCTSLEEIVFENSPIVFEAGSFRDCTSLKTIKGKLDDGWVAFEEFSFKGCTSLESVKIYNDSGEDCLVGAQAFAGCTSLKNFIFHHLGCLNIEQGAFEGCTSLNKVFTDGFTDFARGVFTTPKFELIMPFLTRCHEGWLSGSKPTILLYNCLECPYDEAWNGDAEMLMCELECEDHIDMEHETVFGLWSADHHCYDAYWPLEESFEDDWFFN